MIKREIYMSRIRPFIGNELIKVLTGIRRSGKVCHAEPDPRGTCPKAGSNQNSLFP